MHNAAAVVAVGASQSRKALRPRGLGGAYVAAEASASAHLIAFLLSVAKPIVTLRRLRGSNQATCNFIPAIETETVRAFHQQANLGGNRRAVPASAYLLGNGVGATLGSSDPIIRFLRASGNRIVDRRGNPRLLNRMPLRSRCVAAADRNGNFAPIRHFRCVPRLFIKLRETPQSFDHDLTLLTRCRLLSERRRTNYGNPGGLFQRRGFFFGAANADPPPLASLDQAKTQRVGGAVAAPPPTAGSSPAGKDQ